MGESFWKDVYLHHISFGPLSHLEFYLESQAGKPHAIMTLVTSKLDVIARQFEDLLSDGSADRHWGTYLQISTSNLQADVDKRSEWVADAVHDVLELYSDFSWRVLRESKRFPLKLFWLVLRRPKIICQRRKQVANDLLEIDESLLDNTVLKVRLLFAPEIHEAAETGMLPDLLWDYLNNLSEQWPVDNQLIEGWANIFKRIPGWVGGGKMK